MSSGGLLKIGYFEISWLNLAINPAGICLFKVSSGNTKTMAGIYSKLTLVRLSLLNLNRFHILLCFHCSVWTRKCLIGKHEIILLNLFLVNKDTRKPFPHSRPIFHYYTPWKLRIPRGLRTNSGGIETKHRRLEMG